MADQGSRPRLLTVAVVGAGISGLTAARALAREGVAVTVFERGRGPGGRASRRRSEGFTFDHGAQYFTARGAAFSAQLEQWLSAGVAARWDPRMATAGRGTLRAKDSRTVRYVGVPAMSALARDLAAGLDLRVRSRVLGVARNATADGWMLSLETGGTEAASTKSVDPAAAPAERGATTAAAETIEGPFDAVILAVTPPQGLPLLSERPRFADAAASVRFVPTWAVMLGFDRAPEIDAQGIFIDDPALSWAARNDSKPGREGGPSWVLHASGEWSAGREDYPPQSVADALLPAFEAAVGRPLGEPVFASAHRWRYARTENPLRVGALWDEGAKLGMCGDWCAASRIEGAFESGLSVSRAVMASR